jgi:hypothetical protein
MDKDQEHLRLLSIFHYVVAGMMAFLSCFPVLYVVVGLIMLVASHFSHGPAQRHEPPAIVGALFVVIGSLIILAGWVTAGMIALAGRCLGRHQCYFYCLVVAAISCLFMPVGTILGVFTILVLARPGVKQLFEAGTSPALPPASN